MSRKQKHTTLYDKAEAALLAAIEVYNKPNFLYREETFAILCLNAWELLLKAKLVKDNKNKLSCLYIYETRKLADGKESTKKYLRRNRCNNPFSINLQNVINRLEESGVKLEKQLKDNLEALTEIRDNAVHFVNVGKSLAQKIMEIGVASVKNFLELARRWFNRDLTKYNLFLMPIGFFPNATQAMVALPAEEKKLMSYLSNLVAQADQSAESDLHTSLAVKISFKKAAVDAADLKVRIAPNDPDATKVQVSEEDIRNQYPLEYREMVGKLRDRYTNFRTDEKFHRIKRELEKNPNLFGRLWNQ